MSDYTSPLDAELARLDAAQAATDAAVAGLVTSVAPLPPAVTSLTALVTSVGASVSALSAAVDALTVRMNGYDNKVLPPAPTGTFLLDKTTGNAPLTVQSAVTVQNADFYRVTWDDGKLGLYQHVDAVAIHPYLDGVDPNPAGEPVWCTWEGNSIRRLIGILDKWAPGKNLTVWNTESACPRSTTSEATQATRAAHAFQAFNTWTLADGSKMRNRLGPYFWFTFHDWTPGQPAREASFGLVSPTYVAHQALGAVTPILQAPPT